MLRGAFFAGAMLAFGLSFDEIVVTLFTAPPGVTTLPIWIFQNLFRPNQAPVVNVVAAALVHALDHPDLAVPEALVGFDGAGEALTHSSHVPTAQGEALRLRRAGTSPPSSSGNRRIYGGTVAAYADTEAG